MRHVIFRFLSAIGAALVTVSPFWEYGRMKPDYGFIVDPWSIRGTETIHGAVFAVIGATLLLAALAVIWERATDAGPRLALTAGMAAAGVVIAAIFGTESYTATPNGLLAVVIAAAVAFVVSRVIAGAAAGRDSWVGGGLGTLGVWIATAVVLFFVLQLTIVDNEITVPLWLLVGIPMVLAAALSMGSSPRELAANRMFIFAVMFAGFVITVSSGAIRSTLLRHQFEAAGMAAQYKDAQVTSGWFVAQFGILVLFVGAVAMWARRRDLILNAQRAQRQREAAEKSAREIQAALAAAE